VLPPLVRLTSPARRGLRAFRGAVAFAVVAVSLAGCAATTEMGPPSPTPTDFQGIAERLSARGIVVQDVVSGEAGCDDPDLVPTAIAFTAHGLDQSDPMPIHLYVFRNSDSYSRLRTAVDSCAATYITDPAGYESIDADPFVLTAQGPWPQRFEQAVRDALQSAAAGG
jgi:hypothetical protein